VRKRFRQITLTCFTTIALATCQMAPGPTSAAPTETKAVNAAANPPTPEPTQVGSDVTRIYAITLTRPDVVPLPLPVEVVDHTRLVVGIEAFLPAEEQPVPKDEDVHGIVSDASPQQGFVYSWSANCAVGTTIDIRPRPSGGLVLEAVTTPSSGGCFLAVVYRFLLIKTSKPIPLDAIELR
jgi:hypothetical protein